MGSLDLIGADGTQVSCVFTSPYLKYAFQPQMKMSYLKSETVMMRYGPNYVTVAVFRVLLFTFRPTSGSCVSP